MTGIIRLRPVSRFKRAYEGDDDRAKGMLFN